MLATIGIVDCTFRHLPVAVLRPVPFPILYMEWLFYFHQDGSTERNGNIPILLAATVHVHVANNSMWHRLRIRTTSMCIIVHIKDFNEHVLGKNTLI